MILAKKNIISRTGKTTAVFEGLDRYSSACLGSFHDMLNLSSDDYPSISSRQKRAVLKTKSSPYGSIVLTDDIITAATAVNGKLIIATKTGLYQYKKPIAENCLDSTVSVRQIIPFGRNFFVSPDGIYAQQTDDGYKITRCAVKNTAEKASVTPCYASGEEITADTVTALPDTADENTSVILTTDGRSYLYTCSSGLWSMGDIIYSRFSADNIGSSFHDGDSVILKNYSDENKIYRIVKAEENSLIIDAPFSGLSAVENLSVERYFPCLDFAVECSNRIWGCRCGKNRLGETVNEIYACALGNVLDWNTFDNVSTDAYAVSLGCPGEFTGAAVLDGRPVFFKSDRIVTIGGDVPQSFCVTSIPARGVQKGAYRSIVNIGEKLCYKTLVGIAEYDGVSVKIISDKLSPEHFVSGAAGEAGGKYRIVLTDTSGKKRLYVYDTHLSVWHIEDDDENAEFFVNSDGCLYGVCRVSEVTLPTLSVSTYNITAYDTVRADVSFFSGEEVYFEEESEVLFSAVTNEQTVSDGTSVVRRIVLFAEKPGGTYLNIGISCDGCDKFTRIFHTDKPLKSSIGITVNTPRCSSFRLSFEGSGSMKIKSVRVISEKTGEVNRIDRQ